MQSELPRPNRSSLEPQYRLSRTYLDSFDWRVHAAGGVIEHENSDEGSRLSWKTLEQGKSIATVLIDEPVDLVQDLPDSKLKKILAPVLEMRALLPLV